jgi:alpha-mannosidase
MPLQELIVLLPCHSLEDFPTYHEGEEAESLLASWSALWHPQLLAAAGRAPVWRRVDEPLGELRHRLIVVPSVCLSRLATGFAQRAKDEGGLLIRKTQRRSEIVAAALGALDSLHDTTSPAELVPNDRSALAEERASGAAAPQVDPDLAADFLALGYAYLQVELLTRQMRYASNLDETYFQGTAVAAARAAVAGQTELAREKLAICFNLLGEERDHYYPVDAFLLDLTLTAPTTLGESLRRELEGPGPINVLLPAGFLAPMAEKHPQTLAALREALASRRASLIGGEAQPQRLPLVSLESVRADLAEGLKRYEEVLGQRPRVFGRWRHGLCPTLPGVLRKLGFEGALHAELEEGKTPQGLQVKVQWEGLDGSAIEALAKPPLDAASPQTFLALAARLGESMDSDHVATLCLAHWPGQASPWLDDLRRISRYTSALGKWVSIDDYFAQTDRAGHLDRFEASRYRDPYLRQAIIRKQPDPISSPHRYWQRLHRGTDAAACESLAAAITGTPPTPPQQAIPPADAAAGHPSNEEASRFVQAASGRAAHAWSWLIEEASPAVDADVVRWQSEAAHQWAAALTGANHGSREDRGVLILNPASFVRRVGLELEGLSAPPAVERPVYAAEWHQGHVLAVVDLPPLGFVHLPSSATVSPPRKGPLLAEDGTLRNEFLEAVINPTTGSLAAVHSYVVRGNRLSQQLALRSPAPRQKPGDTHRDPDEMAVYSVMAADAVETTIATSTLGEITTRGRLLDREGRVLARFVQRYRLWRGSRVLHLAIELDPQEEPKPDPWNAYYCCRFAWPDELAELYRSLHQTRQPASEKRVTSPHYVEISDGQSSVTLLTGGLSFHQRTQERFLDTLLISRGERQRHFQLGIGIDLAHPVHEAIGLLAPPIVLPDQPRPASGGSGWLMHITPRHVLATGMEPWIEGGRCQGLTLRLLETAGRPAKVALSLFRPLVHAELIDFLGHSLGDVSIVDGKAQLDLAAYEWVQIRVRW